jgi:protein O-mannosyl-transferase
LCTLHISHKYHFAFIFLATIVLIAYSNTFHASWHLDDNANILTNSYLHLKTLQAKDIVNTFFTDPTNPYHLSPKMYRPVPCLTFALNWYFSKNNVVGYHAVNICIHIVTSFFLFLFIVNLTKTPNLKNTHKINFYIAVLASALWAVHPIQTQSVTYIVQRMAQMAAMFYIIAMFCYLKGRIKSTFKNGIPWFAGCLLFFILAVGSKENAALLPLSLMLMEIIFFQNIADKKTRQTFLLLTLVSVVGVLFFGTIFFMKGGNPLSFIESYNHRSFSLTERVLAQPRVIIFYLSQLFLPSPSKFSIVHDVVLSKSFMKPWTTIPCILIIVSAISLAFFYIRKIPILSFAILFFFLNHAIESSIIPLELIFEHRNYLPSFFIFLPFAILLNYIMTFYCKKNRPLFISLSILIVLIIMSLMISTFIRNKAWKNGVALWTDAAAKAPYSARPLNMLAIKLAWGKNSNHPNRYDLALKLLEKSLGLYMSSPLDEKAQILGNMASIYYNNKHSFKKAEILYKKAISKNPDNLKIRRDLIHALLSIKNFDEALSQTNILILKNNKNEVYHNLRGFILLWQNKPEQALSSFKTAYKIYPKEPKTMFYTGVALMHIGNYNNAEQILLKALESLPNHMAIYFYLIENSLKAKKIENAKKFAAKLTEPFAKDFIMEKLLKNNETFRLPPFSKQLILPVINEILTEKNANAINK